MIVKIVKEYISQRKLPVNLQDADFYKFENSLVYKKSDSFILRLRNIFIIEKVLFSLAKLKFYDEFCYVFKRNKINLFSKLIYFFNRKKVVNKGIWIIDDWSKEYFHWFSDALIRYKSCENLIDDHRVLIPDVFSEKKYIIESLEILKIDYIIYDTKKTLIKDLILPSHMSRTGNFNPFYLNELRKSFIGFDKINTFKNIYISRGKANKRKILNEDELFPILEKYNFEVHFFEEYNLNEQILIMRLTKSLVSLHGAGLTNMLFMPENGNIVELRNNNDSENNCFFSMASDLKHNYYYLECYGDSSDTHNVNVTVDIYKFENILKTLNT